MSDIDRGTVLIIAVDGHLRPSRITGEARRKLLHTDVTGHERAISPKRPLWMSRQRCADNATLDAYWKRVLLAVQSLDLPALWGELQAAAAQLNSYPPADLAALAYRGAEPAPWREDALVAAVFSERLHFRFRGGVIMVTDPESLAAAKQQLADREKMARHESLALRLFRERLAGSSGTPSSPDEEEAVANHMQWLADLALHAKESAHYKSTLKIMQDLELPLSVPTQAAAELLVTLGGWTKHQNVALMRAGLPTAHTEELRQAAVALTGRAADRLDRVDHRALVTVAIDDAHTLEVDDAFAVEGDRLLVFIADAAAAVPIESAVFLEAAARVSTMYLPDARWPMLPRVLGEQHASLLEGEDRLAMCYSFALESDGALRDFTIERALIRVDKRLTYDAVDEALQRDSMGALPPPIAQLIDFAGAAMEAHAGFRERASAMTFMRDEVHMTADPHTGAVTLEPTNPNGPARQLVAEMMVAVCGAVGAHCARHSVPTIFRSQPSPDKPIERPTGPVTDAWQQWNILRRFKPSAISVTPAPHFSLALPAYTQVTSPLRRFQDLVMNHQLAAVALGHRPPFSTRDLREMISNIERRTSEIRSVEQQSRRYWALWYLESHPDVILDGLVVHEVGRRWVIRVPKLALVLTLTPRHKLRRSQAIKLRVEEVDARRDRLILADCR